MKPQTQLRKEAKGDCLRACVATLLEVPIEKVPDFVLVEDVPGMEYPGYWIALQGWLKDRGLWFLEMQLPPNMPWMPLPFDGLCIFFGETSNKIKHAIIGKVEGAEFIPVFNPWPEAEFADGIGALGFIIPRDPAYYIRMGIALAKVERMGKGIFGPVAESIVQTAQQALGNEGVSLFIPNGTHP